MKFLRSIAFLCLTLAPLTAQVILNPNPTRVIGQPSVQVNPSNINPNLVEGREFFSPQAVALDNTLSPPALYVSDARNNRVLGFRNAAAFANGQHADIVIGQPDFFTTLAQGPNRQGSNRPASGLTLPSGLAVDSAGNLYVVDAGNNRILRFPKPFSQTDQFPDSVIGQADFSHNSTNGTTGVASANTLSLASGGSVAQAYITFDLNGNLWVADPGNNRILRFNSSVLGTVGPSADVVLGQGDFVTTTFNPTGNRFLTLTSIQAPTGVAIDPAGRLFVTESVTGVQGRVLVYTPPFTNGKPASRQLGISTANPPPPPVSEFQFQAAPSGVFMIGSNPAVVDTLNSRILIYKPVDQWTADLNTQAAVAVIGQGTFAGSQRNAGQPEATASTLNVPVAAVFSGTELFIADAGNHRVIVRPGSGTGFAPATRVLGQDQFYQSAVNLIEGREFEFSTGNAADAGIAVDLNSNAPHLYVADTYNNRILCFNDVRNVKPGDHADLVIGQPDFGRAVINYPSNDSGKPTATSLFFPTGVAVDSTGNLYVADTGNSRVVRFPVPFANPQNMPAADLVLGQRSLTATKITDPSATTMSQPYGLAFSVNGGLFVSDAQLNRVVFFNGNASTFTNGMAASKVFGQADFGSTVSAADDNRMNAPHHISTDTDDRLYVADTGNNRVTIFDRAPLAGPDPHAAQIITSLNTPRGIFVSAATGEIWVADSVNNRALRFPRFDLLAISKYTANANIPEFGPLALTLDSFGDLYVADTANRVVIHFPGLATLNGANFLARPLAPNTVISLFSATPGGTPFGTQTVGAPPPPLPASLANIQVQLNGQAVPLYFVSPGQINFVVPNNAPTSGTADLLVIRTDTGQVLGNSPVPMAPASPGIFTIPPTGSGQAAVINEDFTINSQTNPAVVNSIISIYGTGEGFVPGAPSDGTPPGQAISTPTLPRVSLGPAFVPDANVTYSGVQPNFPGLWQINVKIPDTVAPSTAQNLTYVTVFINSVPSGDPSRLVNLWVKQK